jgi:hypothetical protein
MLRDFRIPNSEHARRGDEFSRKRLDYPICINPSIRDWHVLASGLIEGFNLGDSEDA